VPSFSSGQKAKLIYTTISTCPKHAIPSIPFRMGVSKTNNGFPHYSNAMISGMVTHTTYGKPSVGAHIDSQSQ